MVRGSIAGYNRGSIVGYNLHPNNQDNSSRTANSHNIPPLVIPSLVAATGEEIKFTYLPDQKKVNAYVVSSPLLHDQNKEVLKLIKSEDLPKELKASTDQEALKSFLENAYAKVATMNNGDIKLYVEQRGYGGGTAHGKEKGKKQKSQDTKEVEANNSLRENLQALYKAQDTLPKLIEDEDIRKQGLEEYYIKLQVLLSAEKEGDKRAAAHDKVIGEKIAIEVENIFGKVDENHPEAGKVLLLGGAGVGKTTLLHYMSHRHSQWHESSKLTVDNPEFITFIENQVKKASLAKLMQLHSDVEESKDNLEPSALIIGAENPDCADYWFSNT